MRKSAATWGIGSVNIDVGLRDTADGELVGSDRLVVEANTARGTINFQQLGPSLSFRGISGQRLVNNFRRPPTGMDQLLSSGTPRSQSS
jgi:hypothetical protein